MIRLYLELLFAFGWLGFLIVGTLTLFVVRLMIRALMFVVLGITSSSKQPPLFRGEGNDCS